MLIVIAGAVIASMVLSALLISAISVKSRSDDWSREAYEPQPAPASSSSDQRFNTPLPNAGGAR
jgi:hypothetical protein